jgi:hypothetical protein
VGSDEGLAASAARGGLACGVTSPLTPLLDLADVRADLAAAGEAVDRAFAQRALRRHGGRLVAEVALRAAVASASLEGHEYEVEQVRAGAVTDPVLHGALRVNGALDGLAAGWSKAPRHALARLHLLAARGCAGVPEDALGRPVEAVASSPRFAALCELVVAPPGGAPALLRAAVVHGELLTLGAFAGPNGVVARAAARLTLIGGGLDPRGLVAPEIGHRARQPEYVGSANAYATGTPDGVRSWLRHYARSVEVAASELLSLAGPKPGQAEAG